MLVCFGVLLVTTGALAAVIGTDFFPAADVGIIKLHVRAPAGTRSRRPKNWCCRSRSASARSFRANETRTINDTIGVPFSFNLAFVPTDNVSAMDAEILISLKPEHHPIDRLHSRASARDCRTNSPAACSISRPPTSSARCSISASRRRSTSRSRIANFDARLRGRPAPAATRMHKDPGRGGRRIIVQMLDYPALQVDVDRQRAAQLGIAQRDVANNMLVSLSRSSLVAPTYFLNPQNGVNYFVAVQPPTDKIKTRRRPDGTAGQQARQRRTHADARQSPPTAPLRPP